jgi:hypothetical protein
MVRTFGWLAKFAVLGFVTLILIGPVVAVVGTLLPFAVIGGIGWVAVRVVRRCFGLRPRRVAALAAADKGPEPASAPPIEGAAAPRADGPAADPRETGRRLYYLLGQCLGWCRDVAPVVGEKARAAGAATMSRLRRFGRLLGEVFYGSAAGLLLAWAFAGAEAGPLVTGALTGAGLGVVVGLSTGRQERPVAAE